MRNTSASAFSFVAEGVTEPSPGVRDAQLDRLPGSSGGRNWLRVGADPCADSGCACGGWRVEHYFPTRVGRARVYLVMRVHAWVLAHLLVLKRLEHPEPGRAAGREDRGQDADDHGGDTEDDELGHGKRELDEVDAGDQQAPEHDPERDPERAPDQRRDHALVPDHPPHLPASHADRTEHPEFARSLEDGEDERVHDPEEADHDREREEDVEDVQDVLQRADLGVDELRSASVPSRSGNAGANP